MDRAPDFRAVSCLLASSWEEEAVREAAAACRARLGDPADLVLAFASSDYRSRLPELIDILRLEGRARRILGGSAEGIFGVGRELDNAAGLSLMFLALPGVDLELFRREDEVAASTLRDRAAAGILVLADPLRSGAQGPLPALEEAFPGVPVVGGMVSGGPEAEDLFLFSENGPEAGSFLAVGFGGPVRIEPLVSQGCRPIGEPFVVTRSRANVVQAIAGRAPYSVLVETYASLDEGQRLSAEGNIFAGLAVREEVEDFSTGDFVIRPILGTDLIEGRLVLSSPPRVGQTIQFQLRDAAVAAEVLDREARRIVEGRRQPFAAFVCAGRGRGRILHGETGTDGEILHRHWGKTPLAGLLGNGEFAPVGERNFRHDHALCGAVFFASGG